MGPISRICTVPKTVTWLHWHYKNCTDIAFEPNFSTWWDILQNRCFYFDIWLFSWKEVCIHVGYRTVRKLGMWVVVGRSITQAVRRHRIRIFGTSFARICSDRLKEFCNNADWFPTTRRTFFNALMLISEPEKIFFSNVDFWPSEGHFSSMLISKHQKDISHHGSGDAK